MATRVSSPIFVGRRAELARLHAALVAASRGHPSAVLIAGEAGVGKTRLVAQFASDIGAEARILRGACVPVGDAGLPYGPIADVFRRLIRTAGPGEVDVLLGTARRQLARLLPALAQKTDVPDAPDAFESPDTSREWLFEILLMVLARLATESPVLLVVEDLHWADRATLDVLSFLLDALDDERVLLVGTYRSDEVDRHSAFATFRAECERSDRAERLELEPFDESEVAELVAGILGRAPEGGLAALIHARSDGNAYYAEELVALGDPTGPLPSSLRDVILDRVERLAAPTRELLGLAAVARERIDAAVLGRAGRVTPCDLAAALRDAVDHHVLVPLGDEGELFEFRHALLADAVYEELLPGERRRLHGSFARALELAAPAPHDPVTASEIAHHWCAADERPRGLVASIRAAAAARSVCAFGDAEVQLERAIGLWPSVVRAADVAGMDLLTLLELAADTASRAGALTRAIAHRRAALPLVDRDHDPVRAGLLYEALGSDAVLLADDDGSVAAYEEAARLVPAAPPSAARARVLAGLARRLMLDGQSADASRTAEEAIRIARSVAAPGVEADGLATLGAIEFNAGDADDAEATLIRARDIALEAGDDEAAARAWANLVSTLEGDASVAEAVALGAWCTERGLGTRASRTYSIASLALWELGRWDEAECLLQQVAASGPEGEEGVMHELARAHLDAGRGAFDAAAARISIVDRHTGRRGNARESWAILAARVETLVRRGMADLPGARAAAERGIAELACVPLGARTYFGSLLASGLGIESELAAVARTRRDRVHLEDARRRSDAILDLARTTAEAVAAHRATAWQRPNAYFAACQAERERVEGVSDPEMWSVAVAACDLAGLLPARTYALLRRAEALLVRGRDRPGSRLALREAHRAATAIGAGPLRSEIETVARRARFDLAGGPRGSARGGASRVAARFGLTTREIEVLALVSAGRTNRQIAEELFIGERTAGIHVSNILGKLGASSRTEAAAIAHRSGLEAVAPLAAVSSGSETAPRRAGMDRPADDVIPDRSRDRKVRRRQE